MVDHFLKKTDFVLGMGTSFTISGFNAPMPPGVTLAHSTNCADDLNKDYRVSYGAIGDAKVVLRQMIEEVKRQVGEHGRGDEKGVAAEISKVKAEFMAEWGPRLVSDEGTHQPIQGHQGAIQRPRRSKLDRHPRLRLPTRPGWSPSGRPSPPGDTSAGASPHS